MPPLVVLPVWKWAITCTFYMADGRRCKATTKGSLAGYAPQSRLVAMAMAVDKSGPLWTHAICFIVACHVIGNPNSWGLSEHSAYCFEALYCCGVSGYGASSISERDHDGPPLVCRAAVRLNTDVCRSTATFSMLADCLRGCLSRQPNHHLGQAA